MEVNFSTNNGPVNFFMSGGRYITNNFNMQIIDTSNPNIFNELAANNATIKSDEFATSKIAANPSGKSAGTINFFTL